MAIPNALPTHDGEWTAYEPETASTVCRGDRLWYVNGMNTSPEQHRSAAVRLANIAHHKVLGLYNMEGNPLTLQVGAALGRLGNDSGVQHALRAIIGGLVPMTGLVPGLREFLAQSSITTAGSVTHVASFLLDIEQCLKDYVLQPVARAAAVSASVAAQSLTTLVPGSPLLPGVVPLPGRIAAPLGLGFSPDLGNLALSDHPVTGSGATSARSAPAAGSFALPSRVKEQAAAAVLGAGNVATAVLFRRLCEECRGNAAIHIVCHSQGNLIVSNALASLCWARSDRSLGTIHVYALASPVPTGNWPRHLSVICHIYTVTSDPVPRLSMGQSYGSGATVVATGRSFDFGDHDVQRYLGIPEFVQAITRAMGVPCR